MRGIEEVSKAVEEIAKTVTPSESVTKNIKAEAELLIDENADTLEEHMKEKLEGGNE